MQLAFQCPRCQQPGRVEVVDSTDAVSCPHCEWSRSLRQTDVEEGKPVCCLGCGCGDLWRQKDFSPRLGLTIVGLGILLSTIAWARMQPVWAIGILMAFALFDLVLYALMSDVLVCYRCGARHRHATLDESDRGFSLEVHERYRQEALRLEQR